MAEARYLPPRTDYPLSQGDMFLNVPFIWLDRRPLVVLRHHGQFDGKYLYSLHKEADGATELPATTLPADDKFRWHDLNKPEFVVAKCLFSMGIVVTHDCECDNDDHRTVAMIRPMTVLPEKSQKQLLANDRTDLLALLPQDKPPRMEPSFIDFRKTAMLRPHGLDPPTTRYASASPGLSEAIAGGYYEYLHHKPKAPRPPIDA